MSYRKKLIEVALPLQAINAAARADKNRKTGTIRNLHKWFAPMPLPAVRALLFSALIDDPGEAQGRRALHDLITELVPADGSLPSSHALQTARNLIAAAFPGASPLVFDPFCGGGSTLVEAQRLGLRAIGYDLSPVAVLISRTLAALLQRARDELQSVGAPPLTRERFVDDVCAYADEVRRRAYEKLLPLYGDADGNPIIAWLWARTVPSPDPRLRGAPTPLVSSWWLSKKRGEGVAMAPVVDIAARTFSIEIVSAPVTITAPSVDRCLFTGTPITHDYIREQARSGQLGLTMLATVTADRRYRPAVNEDLAYAASAIHPPDLDLPIPDRALGFRVQNYGITSWKDIFTARQAVCLATFADLVSEMSPVIAENEASPMYATAISTVLGLCVGKLAQANSTQSRWRVRSGPSKAELAFGMATVPMVWDFAETNPFGGSVGDWRQVVRTASRAFEWIDFEAPPAEVINSDARHSDDVAQAVAVFTDPPYFKQIGYAALSDFFYPWLRRALYRVHEDLFETLLAPKDGELIAEPARHAGVETAATAYFVRGFRDVFARLGECQREDIPIVVVYAYRQQESTVDGRVSSGWDALLEALIDSGWLVTGTWPVDCAGSTRERSQESNALTSYVALACRTRPSSAGITDRRALLGELRQHLPAQIHELKMANIAPVDLAQAAIGPGMAIFSRHAKVLEADGTSMAVRAALGLINQALDEILAEQEGDFDPDTRFAVTWFEQRGVDEGPFGEADVLARAKNTSVDGLERAGVLVSRAGKVRLLRRDELSDAWDPATDARLTVWEVAQHLIKRLEEHGEAAAADLLRRVGGLGETARELAYRLYTTCERKGWAQEALAYNALVIAWPEIARRVAGTPEAEAQQALEV